MQKPILPNDLEFALDIKFSRQFVEDIGEDPTDIKDNWCWNDLYNRYPNLKSKVEEYIEKCNSNDVCSDNVCSAIYNMVETCETNGELAKKLLETCESIYVLDVIQRMVQEKSLSREWGEKQIEKKMKKQMEKCKHLEWRNVKEKNVNMVENDIRTNAIHNMVSYCGSSKEWANKLLTKNGFLPIK